MKNMRLGLSFAVLAAAPLIMLAASGSPLNVPAPPGAPTGAPITTVGNIIDLINNVLTWIAYAFWIVALIFAFFSAFTYLRAAGSEEQLKKAHRYLIYTIVAMIVGILAAAFPTIVNSFLSGI